MDVLLPEKKMNDLPMEDESTLVGESDLNFVVTKENHSEDYIYEDLARSNNGIGLCHEIPGSHHEQPYSSVQAETSNDVIDRKKSSYDQESLQSASKDNQFLAEAEEFIGCNLCKPPSQVEVEVLHHEIEYEASAHSMDSMKDPKEEEKNEDGPNFTPHDELLGETFLEEKISELPTESRELDTPHSDHNSPERTVERSKSPETVGRSSLSPNTSPVIYQSPSSKKPLPSQQVLSNSSGSHEHRHSSSPKRSGLIEEGLSGRLGSRHTGGSSLKHVSSSSPKKHYSPPNHRRRDRSVSRSPHRQKDSSSGRKRESRDYHYRSRSRSPYPRGHHRRSPRRRYSPRRRSPPPSYRSRQRSPRKRPWSPPRNRNTGVGKPGRNLFVAGFNFLTTERELERKFSRFGRVRDIRIVRDKRSGDSRGFGFLSLERDEEADAAIRALDKTEWNGRIVLVEKSKSH